MRFRIAAVGEILWDVFPKGRELGGAPANFACHALALGADACLITRIGDDALGREIFTALHARGLPTDAIQLDVSVPTGTVSVDVTDDGQPRYVIHENVAWDRIEVDEAGLEVARHANAICFGSLAQRGARSRETVQHLVQATRPEALRVFDINLRLPHPTVQVIEQSLALANVLKLNDEELPVLARLFGLSGDVRTQLAALAKQSDLRLIALTRGANGSVLYSAGEWSERPGVAIKVVNTVGAGDSFAAAMIVGYLAGWPLEEVHRGAEEVASFVCTQPGATPIFPDALRARFERHQ